MDNENFEKLTDTVSERDTSEASPSAFDYQAPTVETPAPPTVTDIPVVEDIPGVPVSEVPIKAEESTGNSPTEKTVFENAAKEGHAFQQPMQQPVQQPMQQPFQQPMQQPFQQPVQQPVPSPGVTYQYYQYAPVNPAMINQQNTSDGFAVASLVCAIAGLVSCCTVIPSFLAVIFGAISKAKNDGTRPTGLSTAGLILGILGIIFNLLILLAMFYAD